MHPISVRVLVVFVLFVASLGTSPLSAQEEKILNNAEGALTNNYRRVVERVKLDKSKFKFTELKKIPERVEGWSRGWALGNLEFDFVDLAESGTENSLGLTYDWEPRFSMDRWGRSFGAGGMQKTGFDVGFKFNGTVSFDADINPSDFLVSKFSASFFHINADTVDSLVTRASAKSSLLDAVSESEMRDDAAKAWRKVNRPVEGYGWKFDVEFDGGYETNQTFTARDGTLGVNVELSLNWDETTEDAEGVRTRPSTPWNIFDLPFACIRRALGGDDEFCVRGYLPNVTVGIDFVDPDGNSPRVLVGDDSDYWRLSADVGFKTPLGKIRRARGDNSYYYFDARFRYFLELSASGVVKAANLDQHEYLAISVRSNEGYFLTYKTGKLPFGVRDESSLEAGIKVNF